MYNNKFVATIKSGGKVLRELNDTVYLPFGCEYTVFLKNLNTVRAQVKISIDDQDIGSDLVINPNSEVDIERFIKQLDKGNRFKFIERSASVEQHRGVGASDGLVRIEFQYEQPRPIYTVRPDPFSNTVWPSQNTPSQWLTASGYNVNGMMRSVDYSAGEATRAYATHATNSTLQSMNISATGAVHDGMATMDWAPANDVGITVPGSVSDQKFATVAAFPLEAQKHVIVLQLKGETKDNKVIAPVTVKAKPKCVTCGKVNKATAKFCSNCGTALEIV